MRVGKQTQRFTVLCDTGASTFNFISSRVARRLKLKFQAFKSKIRVRTAHEKILRLSEFVILSDVLFELPSLGETSQSGEISRSVTCATLKAVVIDTCPFEFILGYEDIYNYSIVQKFPDLFYETTPKNSKETATSSTSSSVTEVQGKPADGMTSTRPSVLIDPTHRAAQTAEPATEVRDEHFGASGQTSAACVRGADLAQPPGVVKTKIISKHDLLDVELDDDEIDTWRSIDPWEKYFISAQSTTPAKKLARSSDNSSSLSLNEIYEKLKIEQRCKTRSCVLHFGS